MISLFLDHNLSLTACVPPQNLDKAGVKALVETLNGISFSDVDVVVAPVAIHLSEVVSTIKADYAVSAQNCNHKVKP